MTPAFSGKRVLITGVCGTVGRELLRQVRACGPEELVGFDNNESELFFLSEQHREDDGVRFHLGDIREVRRLRKQMNGMDIVLHTAAFKHVLLCEESPGDAVLTNILGTQNVIDAAVDAGVGRVIFTSSDKAVNPTNVMGTSKLMGERLMTAASSLGRTGGPVFGSTRFGNVLGSRGSVIPLFKKQIEAGGPVTLTDAGMTRFIMTIEDAVRLVMESAFLMRGGEVFVTKMRALRIEDLAAVLIEEMAPKYGRRPGEIALRTVGAKPGEKMYEELVNEEEIRRTVELPDYFVVLPAFKPVYAPIDYTYPAALDRAARPYNSAGETPMERGELRDYLRSHRLLETA